MIASRNNRRIAKPMPAVSAPWVPMVLRIRIPRAIAMIIELKSWTPGSILRP